MIIGLKTIKIALAAGISLMVAELIGLQYATAAAIIAILSVMDTREATRKGVMNRVLSAIIALLIGSACFFLMGYNVLAYVVYLFFFVPISLRLKIDIGMGPSSVLVTHLLASGGITWQLLLNEMLLILIGSGFALIANIYFPSLSKELKEALDKIDDRIRAILVHYASYITQDMPLMKGDKVFEVLEKEVSIAENLLKNERENLFYEESGELFAYWAMRVEQIRILKRMFENLKYMPQEFTQGTALAELMTFKDDNLSEKEITDIIIHRLEELDERYRKKDLPKSLDEFHRRSILFKTFLEFKEFINARNAYDDLM